eukprot:11192958-Lingulodinium_polyedra.AAC.1
MPCSHIFVGLPFSGSLGSGEAHPTARAPSRARGVWRRSSGTPQCPRLVRRHPARGCGAYRCGQGAGRAR